MSSIVIVGGVAGGATAAARLRRLDENANITVVDRGNHVSFANCGLPYHVAGEITDRSRLVLHTPQSLESLLNLTIRTRCEAVSIDRKNKSIQVHNLDTGVKELLKYDKLLLSPGASPLRPPIPGLKETANIFTLRTIEDMDNIIGALGKSKSAIVIGAGFIGLEMVEALSHRGLQVTLIESKPSVLPVMSEDMTKPLISELLRHNINVRVSELVKAFSTTQNGGVEVTLASGDKVQADFVLLSAGVAPDTRLAEEAGLDINPRTRTIKVNQYLQTSDENIYAVGDAVETPSDATYCGANGNSTWIPLAGPANRQARIAAEHMVVQASENQNRTIQPYRGTIGTSIVRVFDSVAGCCGRNEFSLMRDNVPFKSTIVSGPDHASYYPGATQLTVKVLWAPEDGRILGAEVVGIHGVDKRIDVLATAISAGMTVMDLAHLELSYAPPFGSARDVINTVGFTAENQRNGYAQFVDEKFLLDLTAEDPSLKKHTLIDVRDASISKLHPVPGAISIPFPELRSKLTGLDKDTPITTLCALGKTSYFAARVLQQNGFQVNSLSGGLSMFSPPAVEMIKQYHLNHPAIPEPAPAKNCVPKNENSNSQVKTLDACGLACPGPIMKLREALQSLKAGERLEVTASDLGFANDFPAFCRVNNLNCESVTVSKGIVTGRLSMPGDSGVQTPAPVSNNKDVAIVVFSGDMDKVLAAFVIANGAVAMGGEATLFFTFWGLNALRASDGSSHTEKSFLDKAMGAMMPKGADHLGLSQMNMGGLGAKFMKHTMHKKHLPNLPDLMAQAKASGKVRLVACTMSMEALSISAEELVEGCEYGGVADFLASASGAHTTLFI